MKLYKWVVTYVKRFKTGTLKGMDIECKVTYPTEDLAQAMVSFLKTNSNGSDALTHALFTVVDASYQEEITNETDTPVPVS